jgi:2-alkyl-3-oxoalkanoate reductase
MPELVAKGHEVVATTTKQEKVEALCALGARAVVMDGLDAGSVGEVIARAEPEAVIHQMTALSRNLELCHLLAAANAVGVRRFVAQSFSGWPNLRLERAVLDAPFEGLVLRYGSFYGPGTPVSDEYPALLRKRRLPLVGDGHGVWSFVHIDDAAAATVLALERGAPGVYDIVDDEPAPVADWLPYLAACVGAKPPRRVPAWLARLAVGQVGMSLMTQIRGCSNVEARHELGWEPRWPSWREGFRDGLESSGPVVTGRAPVSSLG